MTHNERLLWLAEQEMDCPGPPFPWSGHDELAEKHTPCPTCGGTGKVPQFPTLRRECNHSFIVDLLGPLVIRDKLGRFLPQNERYHLKIPKSQTHANPEIASRCECQGRGWLPVNRLEATVSCAHGWRFERHWKTQHILAYCHLTSVSFGVSAEGPTHNEAAIAALHDAVWKEKPPVPASAKLGGHARAWANIEKEERQELP